MPSCELSSFSCASSYPSPFLAQEACRGQAGREEGGDLRDGSLDILAVAQDGEEDDDEDDEDDEEDEVPLGGKLDCSGEVLEEVGDQEEKPGCKEGVDWDCKEGVDWDLRGSSRLEEGIDLALVVPGWDSTCFQALSAT